MDFLFLISIAPAYLVGSYFVKHDPGPAEPKSAIKKAVLFGIIAVVLALGLSFLMNLVLSGDVLGRVSGATKDSNLPVFVDILIFAAIEELVKAIPIAIYIMNKNFFNEVTDGVIYFAIVGLTFGALENFLYGFTAGEFGGGVVIIRLLLSLFFHGALTSIVGYQLAKAKVTKQGFIYAFLALIGVSLTHAGYNYFVYSIQTDAIFIFGAAAIAILANATMFWLYYQATKNDLKLGLAGQRAMLNQAPIQSNVPIVVPAVVNPIPVQNVPVSTPVNRQEVLPQTPQPSPSPEPQPTIPQPPINQPPIQPPSL